MKTETDQPESRPSAGLEVYPDPDLRKQTPVIFYDGICGLCNRFVRWVIRNDPGGTFRFAPLQGETALKVFGSYGPDRRWMASIVLMEEDGFHRSSTAVLKIAGRLKGFWKLLMVFFCIPEPGRDRLYAFIARNRYHWFGKLEQCPVPDEAVKARFLP